MKGVKALKKPILTSCMALASVVMVALQMPVVSAHGGRALFDPAGDTASFTGLARITCSDDGNGPANHLIARVRDNSAPVAGLYFSMQLLKGTKATSVTDTVSGDADYSEYAVLAGGNGTYYLLLNHTKAGVRDIDLEWHCLTIDNVHTGTDIIADQYE